MSGLLAIGLPDLPGRLSTRVTSIAWSEAKVRRAFEGIETNLLFALQIKSLLAGVMFLRLSDNNMCAIVLLHYYGSLYCAHSNYV